MSLLQKRIETLEQNMKDSGNHKRELEGALDKVGAVMFPGEGFH
jgi:hypothetical protein